MMRSVFRLFSPEQKLFYALMQGTYLAQRWKTGSRITLYHLSDGRRGFFVEVGIEESKGQAVVLRSFSSSVPLADYAHGVRLPEV